MRSVEWFPRMGDIPGVEFNPSAAVERTALANHDAVPKVSRFEFEGRVRESLDWTYTENGEEVTTSASPAHAVAFGGLSEELATSTLLRRLWEGLELPGQATDYHFAIQQVVALLWSRRVAEPEVLSWVEYLNWLDIGLVRAYPDAIRDEFAADYQSRREFYVVSAFNSLITMYSREGFLAEALAVARIAEEFDQGQGQREELEERLALLRAEDGN